MASYIKTKDMTPKQLEAYRKKLKRRRENVKNDPLYAEKRREASRKWKSKNTTRIKTYHEKYYQQNAFDFKGNFLNWVDKNYEQFYENYDYSRFARQYERRFTSDPNDSGTRRASVVHFNVLQQQEENGSLARNFLEENFTEREIYFMFNLIEKEEYHFTYQELIDLKIKIEQLRTKAGNYIVDIPK